MLCGRLAAAPTRGRGADGIDRWPSLVDRTRAPAWRWCSGRRCGRPRRFTTARASTNRLWPPPRRRSRARLVWGNNPRLPRAGRGRGPGAGNVTRAATALDGSKRSSIRMAPTGRSACWPGRGRCWPMVTRPRRCIAMPSIGWAVPRSVPSSPVRASAVRRMAPAREPAGRRPRAASYRARAVRRDGDARIRRAGGP